VQQVPRRFAIGGIGRAADGACAGQPAGKNAVSTVPNRWWSAPMSRPPRWSPCGDGRDFRFAGPEAALFDKFTRGEVESALMPGVASWRFARSSAHGGDITARNAWRVWGRVQRSRCRRGAHR
jgi:hypothetical protein